MWYQSNLYYSRIESLTVWVRCQRRAIGSGFFESEEKKVARDTRYKALVSVGHAMLAHDQPITPIANPWQNKPCRLIQFHGISTNLFHLLSVLPNPDARSSDVNGGGDSHLFQSPSRFLSSFILTLPPTLRFCLRLLRFYLQPAIPAIQAVG